MIDPQGACYHCVSRCVRQAWLCGPTLSSARYAHRSAWLERRIVALGNVFAIDVYAYAVMSNHYHVVVHTCPSLPLGWDAEEVARRWARVRARPTSAEEIAALAADAATVAKFRERLSALSWFMRFINEPLARSANEEEDRTGRFWEGRFRSKRLPDEAALLSCAAYVDLNPIRAGLEADPVRTRYTSIAHRVAGRPGLVGIGETGSLIRLNLEGYVQVLRWIAASDRAVLPPDSLNPILHANAMSAEQWLSAVNANRFPRRRALAAPHHDG